MRIIDAGHIASDVNHDKENRRRRDTEKQNTDFSPRDPDAQW